MSPPTPTATPPPVIPPNAPPHTATSSLLLLYLPPCHAPRDFNAHFVAAKGLMSAVDGHPVISLPALAVA
eukprot:756605-Hanusia_phi.AAC.2